MEKEETKPNNPCAFPTIEHGYDRTGRPNVSTYEGMTLRDYFASKAMASMINNPARGHWDCGSGYDIKHITKWAYKYADEMLKQREL